jgi:hypothetical protein
MRYLYAETSVWNCLCDQNADPQALSLDLAKRDVAFAVGFNVLYEIAKLFFTGKREAERRGRELFTYIKRHLTLQVPILKENWALLIEEAMDVTGDERMQSWFRDVNQYQITIQEIDKLCRGELAPEAARFFESRKSAARTSRNTMKDHLEARPDLKAILDMTKDDDLSHFLTTESMGPGGQFLLLAHLCSEFPKNSPSDLAPVARLLLQSPRYRVSRAMTRAGLYLNWRCVKRGSIRGDLPDDTFHVVSAAYCDIFVTAEADQATIACHAVDGIQAIVTNGNELISDRLVHELDRTIGSTAAAPAR